MSEKILDELYNKFEEFVKAPTDETFKDLLMDLEDFKKVPLCPRCHSNNVIRDGTTLRKCGRIQQYVCKKCNHSYTKNSIKNKKKRDSYPLCPTCKSRVTKNGSVRWTTKEGTDKKLIKYYCKNCNSFLYSKKTEN